VEFLQSFSFVTRDSVSRFAEQCVDKKSATHPDLTMNSPNGKTDTTGLQSFTPSENVLVNAVDKRAIEIKQKGCTCSIRSHLAVPLLL
jgi:hypothetical protein